MKSNSKTNIHASEAKGPWSRREEGWELGEEKETKEREKKVLQGDCKILEEVDYVYIVNGHDLGNMRNCFELEFLSNKIIFKNEEVLVLEL
jgi:hypothetical protein